MPTPTYIPLANTTLTSAVSSVNFGSIPQTYNDLILVVVATGSTTLSGRLRFNSVSSPADYLWQRVSGNGSAASAAANSGQPWCYISELATAGTGANILQMNVNIMSYSTTDRHKAVVSRAGNPDVASELLFTLWPNNSAVTSLQVLASTGNWAIGSSFALYGVIA